MKRNFYFMFCLIGLLIWSSCRQDFEFETNNGQLRFSKDTVYLDTVFTNIGSSTYTLKIYNDSDSDLVIPSIELSNGQNSNYRMTVDGRTGNGPVLGKYFENVELLAKDSMYVFIETTVDINSVVSGDTQFLYTDAIEFASSNSSQKVELVTLVKDAVFIYPQKTINGQGETIIETLLFDVDGDGIEDETSIQGRFLEDSELLFTNEKPYVIYGFAAVGSGKTLTIEAGARVHFHANSGLLVTDNASIHINGEPSTDNELLENEVIIQGDRLEPLFEDIPGQWATLWLYSGSTNNRINHATIKNSIAGILCEGNPNDSNKLQITNSQIYNSSNFGILGRATSINGENLVINNSGFSSFAGTFGGNYNLTHSTIANYWTTSFRPLPSLLLNNFLIDQDGVTVYTNPLESANFTNCIIYGNDNPELLLEKNNSEEFNFKFTNCLISFRDPSNQYSDEQYNFDDTNLYENTIFNLDPLFLDPINNQLNISTESPATGTGVISGNLNVDVLNRLRSNPPDLGAYKAEQFED